MPRSPQVSIRLLADADDVAGVPSTLLDERIISLSYEDTEKGSDVLTLTVDNRDLALFETDDDVLGGRFLSVAWGYPGEMGPPRRVVVKEINGFEVLTVKAMTLGVLMNQIERTRAWSGVSRSDVVREVAEANGYRGALLDVETTSTVLDLNQLGETDAALLRRLARAEGFQFWVDDTGLHWRSRRFDATPSHRFVWRSAMNNREAITSVRVESNLLRQVGKVRAVGRDAVSRKDVEASATPGDADRTTLGDVLEVVDPDTGATTIQRTNATERIVRASGRGEDELRRQAATKFRQAERENVRLTVSVIGDPTIRAKGTVQIDGISSMLSGLYYVSRAEHRLDASGYAVEMGLIRDAHGALARRAAQRAQPQGGERNRAEVDPKKPEIFERVDADTGRARVERRFSRRAMDDPEG